MEVVTFAASPRRGGNSETLLDEVIAGLREGGVPAVKLRTHDLDIAPCTGCGGCHSSGRCVIEDGFQAIYDRLVACDGMVFATPLYFMNVPARAKALIDRCQSFWAAREILGLDLFGGRRRFGLVVGCSAKRHGPEGAPIFRGLADTMTYVMEALGMTRAEPVHVSGVEETGAVAAMPKELARAHAAGRELAGCIAAR